MIKLLFCLLVVRYVYGFVITSENWETQWDAWKTEHDKSYVEEEEDKRQTIWEDNYRKILKHNYEFDLGKKSYRLGLNKFADMTTNEYKAFYLGVRKGLPEDICQKNVSFEVLSELPEQLDWREKGYVTPVKNQGNCGSCWAFSATGSLEGQHFKQTGNLVSLSEQNLIDCSIDEIDQGCGGGTMADAFKYIRDNGGIDSEKSYPYDAKRENCHFNKNGIGATLTGCVDVSSGDEQALKVAVAKVGPISIAIDAGHLSFQLYSGGIYYEPQCSSEVLDHGVLVVGYGSENGTDYWIVKNSWGEGWGKEGGYIRMARNMNNNCGIATAPTYPLV